MIQALESSHKSNTNLPVPLHHNYQKFVFKGSQDTQHNHIKHYDVEHNNVPYLATQHNYRKKRRTECSA
jgi:hypothetical protein